MKPRVQDLERAWLADDAASAVGLGLAVAAAIARDGEAPPPLKPGALRLAIAKLQRRRRHARGRPLLLFALQRMEQLLLEAGEGTYNAAEARLLAWLECRRALRHGIGGAPWAALQAGWDALQAGRQPWQVGAGDRLPPFADVDEEGRMLPGPPGASPRLPARRLRAIAGYED